MELDGAYAKEIWLSELETERIPLIEFVDGSGNRFQPFAKKARRVTVSAPHFETLLLELK